MNSSREAACRNVNCLHIHLGLLLAMLVLGLANPLQAAISVGGGGVGPLLFDSQPTVADGWSTITNGGIATDLRTAAALDGAVNTNEAAFMTFPIGGSATAPPANPSVTPANIPRWNSTLRAIQTVATGGGYVSLLATLRNDTGDDLAAVKISYSLNEYHATGTTLAEEIPGHRVYWSLSGSPGSWQVINSLSSVGTAASLTAIIDVGVWANGTQLYLLWADDNADAARDNAGAEDGGYTIDNFTAGPSTDIVLITSPVDGQAFVSGAPVTVTADARMPGTVNNVQFRSNGASIGNDASAPYSIVYNNAPLGTNLLTAVGTDSLGNTLTSAPVRLIVQANQAPVVTIVGPNAFEYVTSTNTAVWADARDDGTVAQVRFYDGTTLLGTDTTAPYSVLWPTVPVGKRVVTAVATDNAGLSTTSAPVTIHVVRPLSSLVPLGATWRYLDTGVEQFGAGGVGSWTDFQFDDSSWSNGVAELGYGDTDESTVVQFGPDANNKRITTYFRHRFNLVDPNSFTSLSVRLRADDGAVVYLNNQVLMTYNMQLGGGFAALATAGLEDDPIFGTNIVIDGLNVALLFDNVVAVEVHQSAANSSDMSFDLELVGNPPSTPPGLSFNVPSPSDIIVAPAVVSINVTSYDLDGSVTNMDFYDNGEYLASFPNTTFNGTYSGVGPGLHTIMAVVTDNSGLSATSTVTVLVRPAPIDVVLVPAASAWSYLDNGTDQGTAWRALNFPAGDTWPTANAEFGYGDGDEVTVVNYGPDANNKFITTYFRRVFNVASTNDFNNVQVRLRRDDGGVVYVNGVEVYRNNMPAGIITYTTPAGPDIVSETAFMIGNFSPGLLTLGDNIVAVEVHQAGATSSDMSFDLQLVGQIPAPSLVVTLDSVDRTLLHLSWAPVLPGYQLEEAPDLTGPWTPSFDQSNPQGIVFDLNDPAKFYRLVAP